MALEALKALFKPQAQRLSRPNSAELQESEMLWFAGTLELL